jgi:hypothetical protein
MEESKLFTPTRLTKKAATTVSSSSLSKVTKDTRDSSQISLSQRMFRMNCCTVASLVSLDVEEQAKNQETLAMGGSRLRHTPEPKILIDMYNKRTTDS